MLGSDISSTKNVGKAEKMFVDNLDYMHTAGLNVLMLKILKCIYLLLIFVVIQTVNYIWFLCEQFTTCMHKAALCLPK